MTHLTEWYSQDRCAKTKVILVGLHVILVTVRGIFAVDLTKPDFTIKKVLTDQAQFPKLIYNLYITYNFVLEVNQSPQKYPNIASSVLTWM